MESRLSVSGLTRTQSHAYDSYGSITSISTNGVTRNTPTTYSTNRLSSGVYDARGNLTSYNGTTYVYDRLNRMIRTNHPGVSLPEDWLFAYTADDERIVAFCLNGESINQFRWMLRNLDGKVIREFRGGSSTTDVYYDYAYRGDQLLAAEIRNAGGGYDTRHYTLDHLGTPRLVTDDAKNRLAEYEYYPYGDSATTASPIGYLRFTGHERDTLAEGGSSPTADDLDYMHARFFNPVPGRFQSFDPVGGNPRAPQSWNRFAYVLGNPLKYVDPTGLKECEVPNCTVDGEAPPIGLPPTYLNTEFEKFKAEFAEFKRASRSGDFALQVMRDVARDTRGLPEVALATTEISLSLYTVGVYDILLQALQGSPDPLLALATARIPGISRALSIRVLQNGKPTLLESTVRALRLSREVAHRALESLKESNGLPSSHHGRIYADGRYTSPDGRIDYGKIHDYAP